jgi:transcriptional regulator with XRE-family HTH domain
MTLNKLLKEKKLTKYQLANITKVPYSTISDIFNEKRSLEKSSVIVVHKIAQALDTSIEELLKLVSSKKTPHRSDFEIFKSNLRHQLHDSDDRTFMERVQKEDLIRTCFEREWIEEALYSLALFDYLCRVNNLPYEAKYDEYRAMKLDEIVYPADVIMMSMIEKNDHYKKQSFENSLPEFKRFNIVENEIRNVK